MKKVESWKDAAYPPPKERPNPLGVAALWLGPRLEERPSGFWLDNQPASLTQVMKETNRLLKKKGQEMVGPEAWR